MGLFNVIATAFALLGVLVALSSGQTFTTHPVPTAVTLGESAMLSCGVTDLDATQYVAWFKGAGQLTRNETVTAAGDSYEVQVRVNGNELVFELTITNTGKTDGGNIGCRIQSDGDPSLNIASMFVTLVVQYLPSDEYPVCNPSGTFTMMEGQESEIVCESELGSPQVDISWERVDERGTILNSALTISSGKKILSYTSEVTRAHNGTEYICTILSLSAFPDFIANCISGPINVPYPPDDITLSLTTHQSNSAFRCTATGNPLPTFTWTFNIQVTESLYNIMDDGQLLVLLDEIPCDVMDIIATCTASNSEGTFTRNTTLCKVPTCTPTDTVFNSTEGDSLTLSCQLNEPVELTWTQVNLATNTPEELKTAQSATDIEHQLTVNREDAQSRYECSAINMDPPWRGLCQSGPLVNVFFPPNDIAVSLTAHDMNDAFRCTATGYPALVTFTWTFNTQVDSSLYRIMDNNQLLVLLDTITCDTIDIIATCEASNSIGTFSVNTTLCKVPSCSLPDAAFNKTEGESFTLSCEIDGSVDSVDWTATSLVSSMTDVLTSTATETMLDYDINVNREVAQTLYECSATETEPSWVGSCRSGPLVNVLFPPNDIAISPTTHVTNSAFRCSATAFPIDITYAWSFNTEVESSLYSLMDDNQLLVLLDTVICDITDIVATCNASNSIAAYTASITLCRVPTCTPSNATFDKTEGERVALSCEINGPIDSLNWTRTNLVSNMRDELVMTQTDTTLNYDFNVNREHSQTLYVCSARNSELPWIGMCQSGPLDNVLYPPTDITISQDGQNEFRCSATGYPSPMFEWTFNTEVDEALYQVADNGQLLELLQTIVCNVTDIIATCTAENSVDRHTAEITLCKVPTCTPPNNPSLHDEGETVSISCQIDESVESMTWTRTYLMSGDSVLLQSVANSSSLSYEWEVNRNHTDTQYKCSAVNTSPSWMGVCQSGPLDIGFPPDDVSISSELVQIGGVSYESYLCTATSNRYFSYVWFTTPPLDVPYETIDGNQRYVVKGNVRCDTEDIHVSCHATTNLRSYSADITLCRVPTCSPRSDFVITEGVNETLTCQHDVSPVNINWSQDGVLAMGQSSTELTYMLTAHRNNTGADYTCAVSTESQPTYEGVCTSGPLTVHYPPDQISIQLGQFYIGKQNYTSYNCSAEGVPEISYEWKFNSELKEENYMVENEGRQLVLLNLKCEDDIFATCTAKNTLNETHLKIQICKPGNDKAPPDARSFEITPAWIAIFAIFGVMVLAIIIALIICAVQQSPLISVDVENHKQPEEEGNVKPTKLSLAPSETSVEMNDLGQMRGFKLSLATSDVSTDQDAMSESLVPSTITEMDEPREAQLVGLDNPSYTSFKANGPNGEPMGNIKQNKPDLLAYMTRPDSMDVDITMGNENVGESNLPNGSVGESNMPNGTAGESNLNEDITESNTADEAIDETNLANEPPEETNKPEELDSTAMDPETTEETNTSTDYADESNLPGETPEESSMNTDETPETIQLDSTTDSADTEPETEAIENNEIAEGNDNAASTDNAEGIENAEGNETTEGIENAEGDKNAESVENAEANENAESSENVHIDV